MEIKTSDEIADQHYEEKGWKRDTDFTMRKWVAVDDLIKCFDDRIDNFRDMIRLKHCIEQKTLAKITELNILKTLLNNTEVEK